jgi:hypothetical protein
LFKQIKTIYTKIKMPIAYSRSGIACVFSESTGGIKRNVITSGCAAGALLVVGESIPTAATGFAFYGGIMLPIYCLLSLLFQRFKGHYSLIATLVERLYSDYRFSFLAFHPVFKLQRDVTDDRSKAAPFVSNFFQVAKHSIATLNMIFRTDLATTKNGTLKVVE